MNNNETLFSGFEAITKEQWIEKIQKDLKGKSFEKLYWSPENMIIPPFYVKKDLAELPHLKDRLAQKALKLPHEKWLTAEYFNLIDKELFSQISVALKNDIHTLKFKINEENLNDISKLFGFLELQKTKIKKLSFLGQNEVLKKLIEHNAVLDFIFKNPKIKFLFGFNFLSELTITGSLSLETEFIYKLIQKFSLFSNVRFLLVNGDYYTNSGASVVQELAFSLAIGNTYLSFFKNSKDAAAHIEFLFSTGNNYFFEIAKLRAFRILWAKLLQYNDIDFNYTEKIYLSSETSSFNKTIYDPYVNMIRNTTEAMAAIIGGTNELTVLPFNFIFEKDSDFGKRIARNVQHLLRYETYLNTVNDIPAGSYYIENLTHLLSENTWELFKEIEINGGYEKKVKTNWVKQIIEDNAEKIIENFNQRKKVLVGINNYPNISEDILSKISSGIIVRETEKTEGLRIFRMAEQLETIRLNTEKLFREKPKVFLFTYGNLSMQRARAEFALNFLGTAGFNILDNNGFSSVDEGIAAFEKSNADILVVCSANEEYAQVVPDIEKHIHGKILIVAGNPERINMSANVGYYIFSGSNILDTLQKIQKQLLKIKEIV